MPTTSTAPQRRARLPFSILTVMVAMLMLVACRGNRPPGDLVFPEGVLYQDDFEQDYDYWELADDGIVSYVIEQGHLVVTINDTNSIAWSPLNFTFDDFILEVDTLQLDGPLENGFGVLFRYQDSENYYRFDIGSDGFYSLSKSMDGTLEAVSEWKDHPAILTGAQTNRIRIEALGDSFRFAVNDAPLVLCVGPEQPIWDPSNRDECLGGEVTDTWSDDTFSEGQIALGVTALLDQGPSIGFDNLIIREP